MITRNFEITIRIPEQNYIPTLFQVVENDNDVYNLTIHITDGINEIDYSQVSSATITFALANGAVVQSDPERLTVSATGIIYQMGTSEIACPGKVLASIQLFGEDGERLTTARFQFEVVADLITPGAVQSESHFPLLQQLVADVEQLKQDIVDLQIPDNSIMDVKLSDAAGQIKQRFATHMADSASHGGIQHKNLLHNWDFRNPVNQRGLTSTPTSFTNAYTIDRWKIVNIGTIAVNSGYITVAGTWSYTPALRQIVETERVHFAGKKVTFSAYVKGSCKLGIAGYGENYVNLTSWTLVKRTVTLTAEGDLYVDISALDVNGSFDVLCAKLELGSESTLANDAPADYGEQLALCQRYYQTISRDPIGMGYINSAATTAYIAVPTPVTMRTTPTLVGATVSDFKVRQNATDITPTALDITKYDNCIVLRFTVEGATAREIASAYAGVNIALSADL